jgi:hypothetical protein
MPSGRSAVSARRRCGGCWAAGGRLPPPFRLESGFARTRQVSGFNGVPGVPRAIDLALAAGSVWRFAWDNAAPEERRKDARIRLEEAHRWGLGLRRGEGFGRILLDLPWHGARIDQLASTGDATGLSDTPEWAAVVPAEAGRPKPGIYDLWSPRGTACVRCIDSSPLRARRRELDTGPIAEALRGLRTAPEAAARWLYQASLAADPWTLIGAVPPPPDGPSARAEKDGRREFRALLDALQKRMKRELPEDDARPIEQQVLPSDVVEILRAILLDLSEALAERAVTRRTPGDSPPPDEEADNARD